jgi:hypothetical protein
MDCARKVKLPDHVLVLHDSLFPIISAILNNFVHLCVCQLLRGAYPAWASAFRDVIAEDATDR